ncbi:hypothetical protein SUGI_0285520 [Cryptomeria japonica]|nr:hypothetical protein SUGI_0285520 [Cryptomeria japonica]
MRWKANSFIPDFRAENIIFKVKLSHFQEKQGEGTGCKRFEETLQQKRKALNNISAGLDGPKGEIAISRMKFKGHVMKKRRVNHMGAQLQLGIVEKQEKNDVTTS